MTVSSSDLDRAEQYLDMVADARDWPGAYTEAIRALLGVEDWSDGDPITLAAEQLDRFAEAGDLPGASKLADAYRSLVGEYEYTSTEQLDDLVADIAQDIDSASSAAAALASPAGLWGLAALVVAVMLWWR